MSLKNVMVLRRFLIERLRLWKDLIMFVLPLIKDMLWCFACYKKDLMVLIGMSLRNGGIIISISSFSFHSMKYPSYNPQSMIKNCRKKECTTKYMILNERNAIKRINYEKKVTTKVSFMCILRKGCINEGINIIIK